jgi:hypothetical protein
MIRQPQPREIELLPQIENEADRRYARVGLRQIIDMPPAAISSLERGRREGLLWVAVSPVGRVVGFALMKRPGGLACSTSSPCSIPGRAAATARR